MASSNPERVVVRVVYAPAPCGPRGQGPGPIQPQRQPPRLWEVELELACGATVGDAVAASGLLQHVADLAAETLELGVFNRRCNPDRPLQDGDRVEIYRPLLIDPKAARHLRVEARRKAEARARQAARTAAGGTREPGGDQGSGG